MGQWDPRGGGSCAGGHQWGHVSGGGCGGRTPPPSSAPRCPSHPQRPRSFRPPRCDPPLYIPLLFYPLNRVGLKALMVVFFVSIRVNFSQISGRENFGELGAGGKKIETLEEMKVAAEQLLASGSRYVLVKGGHLGPLAPSDHPQGPIIADVLCGEGQCVVLSTPYVE